VSQGSEKIIVIDINLTRGLAIVLAAALLLAAALGTLAWGQQEATAASPEAPTSSAGMRQYYVTWTRYDGLGADGTDGNGAGVCADGYHFASLWEIADPSNLKYNQLLGDNRADSGKGPCSVCYGWVRTGYASRSTGGAGEVNCDAWTSNSEYGYGTLAQLDVNAEAGAPILAWETFTQDCSQENYVWCVED
jgi:hypothetical protein